jgi:hypothetical protein
MLSQKPLLILGYNRPEKTRQLIDSLRNLQPNTILFSVDGPKCGNSVDALKVLEVEKVVETIDWQCSVETRFRDSNLGLRKAVVDSVNWALDRFGCVTVIEDDALPGPEFIQYSEFMIDRYRFQDEIAHINGYNIAPPDSLTYREMQNRISIYPASYAWSTWARAWKHFDTNLEWGTSVSIEELVGITGSLVGALKWKLNFLDAKAERIDTWAYRWIASMWSKNLKTIGPNINISSYHGWSDGTHTRSQPTWQQLEISNIDWDVLRDENLPISTDESAERWLSSNVYGETVKGLVRGVFASVALHFLTIKNSNHGN